MYLVIGATGNVGSEVVNQLISRGQDVRALVRSEDRASALPAGVSYAVGDLDDTASLTAAAQGAEGVFFMQLAPSTEQAQGFIDAVQAAGVGKVVLLSSLGTLLHPAPTIGQLIAARDAVFRSSTLDVTYLYASGLMSNATWWAETIRSSKQVVDATEPGKIGVVDPFDIGRVAAIALSEAGHAGKGYLLTGPEALSPSEMTATLSNVLGAELAFVASTPEAEADKALAKGTPEFMARARQNLDELFRAGRAGVITDDVQNLTGQPATPFRTWAVKHADLFA
ncbi:hypothetical protein BIU98_00685 [Curtobacterium sp. MMLR14_010]|uniref:NAD(P)H-binding protein n=1 Tax=Curtobacterium sp. MMLR14_010 TaxID=1898743 RepID=UPI0008DEA77C|nr:NAD(P)H-binding protein [Curtobacterium sp. MMLR14_010]OII36099.1 hypothetical protein BIU98_00685 [Curtobacterium sp. MMLR14_010]